MQMALTTANTVPTNPRRATAGHCHARASMNGEYLRVTASELRHAIDDPDWALEFAGQRRDAADCAETTATSGTAWTRGQWYEPMPPFFAAGRRRRRQHADLAVLTASGTRPRAGHDQTQHAGGAAQRRTCGGRAPSSTGAGCCPPNSPSTGLLGAPTIGCWVRRRLAPLAGCWVLLGCKISAVVETGPRTGLCKCGCGSGSAGATRHEPKQLQPARHRRHHPGRGDTRSCRGRQHHDINPCRHSDVATGHA